MLADKNIASEFSADVGYALDSSDAKDMRSQLPAKWDTAPLGLSKRSEHDGAVRGFCLSQ